MGFATRRCRWRRHRQRAWKRFVARNLKFSIKSSKRDRKIRRNRKINRIDWQLHVEQLCDGEFARRYRMSEEKFNSLLSKCADVSKFFRPLDEQQKRLVRNSYGCEGIDPRHKLGAAMRWCSGGSYLDIRLVHTMSKTSMYECVWQMVDAINKSPDMKLSFPWDDEDGLNELEMGFAKLSKGKVRGCVFSVDGFCIRIIAPTNVPNTRDYWHRKGFYAIVVQAVVDSVGHFRSASFQAVGSTHDSLAFKMSQFYANLEAGKLSRSNGIGGLRSFFGMGDDAYGNRKYLLTPWPGRDISRRKDTFNYWQSRLRIPVECSFGRLTHRWGCLWRPLSCCVHKVPSLITALMKIHNMVDSCNPVRILRADLNHFMRTNQTPCVFVNGGGLTGSELHEQRRRRRVETRREVNNSTRNVITDHLQLIGASRPPHSRYTVRPSFA